MEGQKTPNSTQSATNPVRLLQARTSKPTSIAHTPACTPLSLKSSDNPWRCYEHNFTRIVHHHVAVHQHLQYLHVQHGLAGRLLDSRLPILSKPMSSRISLLVTDVSLRSPSGLSDVSSKQLEGDLGILLYQDLSNHSNHSSR
jgi:hypothetical protein